jgi:hypothetical protein
MLNLKNRNKLKIYKIYLINQLQKYKIRDYTENLHALLKGLNKIDVKI